MPAPSSWVRNDRITRYAETLPVPMSDFGKLWHARPFSLGLYALIGAITTVYIHENG